MPETYKRLKELVFSQERKKGSVIPAQAGNHSYGLWNMDSRLRGNDVFCLGWIPAFAGMTGVNDSGMRGEESGFAILQNRKADWPPPTVQRKAARRLSAEKDSHD